MTRTRPDDDPGTPVDPAPGPPADPPGGGGTPGGGGGGQGGNGDPGPGNGHRPHDDPPDQHPHSDKGSGSARARAGACRDAAAGLADGEVYAHRTADGKEVHVQWFEYHDNGDVAWVELYLAGTPEGGDPHFRIYNPPVYTPDPLGDTVKNGVTFRLDPLAAVCDVVASLGGASVVDRGRRT